MSSSETQLFYEKLPSLEHFFDAANPNHYSPLPEDWYVAVTDIVNSTDAVGQNRYREVNILGAAPIVGVLNLTSPGRVPYIFGGDGAAICLPPNLREGGVNVLRAVRQIGRRAYNLDIRAAIIPVHRILREGVELNVARFRVSEHCVQALFSGGGINMAEQILKEESNSGVHIELPEETVSADFSGLECRWNEVHSSGREIITLLVHCHVALDGLNSPYEVVLDKMRALFGFDEATNPIDPDALSMTFSFKELMGETRLRTFGKTLFRRILYLLKTKLQILLGKLFMRLGYRSSATDWGLYKQDLALNADHRKFDDMMRVVISGTTAQRRELEQFLEEQYQQGRLAYGLHVSEAAIITCMVFKYHRKHIHFIDGSGGGYVEAARDLKRREAV